VVVVVVLDLVQPVPVDRAVAGLEALRPQPQQVQRILVVVVVVLVETRQAPALMAVQES